MLKIFRRQPWTCRQCVLREHRAQSNRRIHHEAGAGIINSVQDYAVACNEATKRHDDNALRMIFDSQPFWREFSRRKSRSSLGLLQNQHLTSPKGFLKFASVSLQKCQEIMARVLEVSTLDGYKRVAKDLDRLSDLLCRVIDIADFMRSNHPNPAIQDAATQAHSIIFEYMNVLNTETRLNDILNRALWDPEISSDWSQEEKVTAMVLINDFMKSGIHLPPEKKKRFVELCNSINDAGFRFVNGMEPKIGKLSFHRNKLRGMDPTLLDKMRRWSDIHIPIDSPMPDIALKSVHDENTRKLIYLTSRKSSDAQLHRLTQLLELRAELAQLTGYRSYAHMAMSDKMAKSPEAVNKFLLALNSNNRELTQNEIAKLDVLKMQDYAKLGEEKPPFAPWDHAYYVEKYATMNDVSRKSRAISLFSSFFSLGTVMQGLSRLFTRLYGVRLVPKETPPGETWNPDVRRLDVVDESNNHLAVIYCDLFTRPGKSPIPTHFTLRCSRAISAEEISEAAMSADTHPNDGMATAIRPGTNTLYQLPIIALVCDFSNPSLDGREPSLLSKHSVQTLFHEMGHAIHSVLARTDFQTIAGTRCATDFVELPSVIMESFATAPEVLSLYARHWETDQPLPEDMIQTMRLNQENYETIQGAMDNEAQIMMSLLDQAYHDSSPLQPGFDSTQIFHNLYSQHATIFDPINSQTSWQGYFGHLFNYGASYYSYLFDRAIASKIWSETFQEGKLATDREAGEKFKNEVLRWGGGRDGWQCVAGVLGDQHPANANGKLSEGGEDAMLEVGLWGLGQNRSEM
ncbi:metallopeptidase Mip1 [Histoplasma capsulatum G186AR]|uniref:Mitochondrial intermediate peptidase n=2 Tax=Ajellomyces capsulatus TaxID=5037 RepID=C0NCU0_AJECG|nr:metallopeptidase Mip1 [Histoplasma capsulatum G186AR]EEH11481.1 metallopeptidase Mip1 [Histoplasma capsulatum G186AR]KAG5302674.1 metallopeptidase Mip1 [Histoplasma capsulatum]QSS71925.1 metallopeptidase Mip1 [Histoplasma capsulatum G186AR]